MNRLTRPPLLVSVLALLVLSAAVPCGCGGPQWRRLTPDQRREEATRARLTADRAAEEVHELECPDADDGGCVAHVAYLTFRASALDEIAYALEEASEALSPEAAAATEAAARCLGTGRACPGSLELLRERRVRDGRVREAAERAERFAAELARFEIAHAEAEAAYVPAHTATEGDADDSGRDEVPPASGVRREVVHTATASEAAQRAATESRSAADRAARVSSEFLDDGCPTGAWWVADEDVAVCAAHAVYLSERARRLDAIADARAEAATAVTAIDAAAASIDRATRECQSIDPRLGAAQGCRQRSERLVSRRRSLEQRRDAATARANQLDSGLIDFGAAHAEAEGAYRGVHARQEAELSQRAVAQAEGIEAEAAAEEARRAALTDAERASEDRAAERSARREAAAAATAAAEIESAAAEAALCGPYPATDARPLRAPRCGRHVSPHVTRHQMDEAARDFQVLLEAARDFEAANRADADDEYSIVLCDMSDWQDRWSARLQAMVRRYDCVCGVLPELRSGPLTCADAALKMLACHEHGTLAETLWAMSSSAERRARELMDPSLLEGLEFRSGVGADFVGSDAEAADVADCDGTGAIDRF